jgi:hypothetical protein
MFELSDPDRGLLEQTYALRFRLKFALYILSSVSVFIAADEHPHIVLSSFLMPDSRARLNTSTKAFLFIIHSSIQP